MGCQKGRRASNRKRGMGQEVRKVKQGARGAQPIAGAAFQSTQAVGGCCSPSVALHLRTKGVLEIFLSFLFFFFLSHGWSACLGRAEESRHRLLEWRTL